MCENGKVRDWELGLHKSHLHYCIPQLLQLFKAYAKTYSTIGLTKEEFGDFLIEECSVCSQLMLKDLLSSCCNLQVQISFLSSLP